MPSTSRHSALRTLALAALLGLAVACARTSVAPAPLSGSSAPPVPAVFEQAGYRDGMPFALERQLVPGVRHRFDVLAGGPLTINTITMDLSAGHLRLEAEKGQRDMTSRETVPALVRRIHDPAARPIAAINADFWGSNSVPIGPFVDEGMIWKSPFIGNNGEPRSVFAWDADHNIHIGRPDWSTHIRPVDGTATLVINRVNFPVVDEPVTVYTWPIGDTAPELARAEQRVAVRLDAPGWLPNKPAPGTVEPAGSSELAPDRVIVSIADGTLPEWLAPGRRVVLDARLGGVPGPVVGLVGGGPQLLHRGEIVVDESAPRESIAPSFVTTRHPRTAVGVKADGKTVVWTVVDGRQAGRSIGIDLVDLAQWLKDQGCVDAINLDGGGSSTMTVRDELVNFPSDAGGPRAVTNAVVLQRTAPLGKPARLAIEPEQALLAPSSRYELNTTFHNAAGEPLAVEGWRLQWKLLQGDATLTDDGVLTTGPNAGAVTVQAIATSPGLPFGGTFTESGPGWEAVSKAPLLSWTRRRIGRTVTLEVHAPARVAFSPHALLLDRGEVATVRLNATDAQGRPFWNPQGLRLVTVPAFASLDTSKGVLTAEQAGADFLKATFGGIEARLPVAVERFETREVFGFETLPAADATAWLETMNHKPEATALTLETTTRRSGAASWSLAYGMAPRGTTRIGLPIAIELPGEPLAVGVWIHGDGQDQWLRGDLRDARGNRYYLDFTTSSAGIAWKDEWRLARASLINPTPAGTPDGPLAYPLTLHALYLVQPNADSKRDGRILLDSLTTFDLPAELRAP